MIRGVHVLALTAILLSAVSARATEYYATSYQSLPVLDWLESRPPLADSADVPAATDLVRGLLRVLPLLTIREDAQPYLPVFGAPSGVQRTINGVRDASRIQLGSPGTFPSDQVPVQARLIVIVFNRVVRAAAWSDLMARTMDIRDPDSGLFQARLSGPEETDGVWVVQPRQRGGIATVVGHRGAVGFAVQVTFFRPDTEDRADRIDLSARAEATVRQAAADWSAWLVQQLAS